MKYILTFALLIALPSSHADESPFSEKGFKKIEDSIKKIDVTQIPLSDLRNYKNVRAPLLPTVLPSPFDKKKKVKLELWAHSCAPCLVKLERKWKEPDMIWINIDHRPGEIEKSLDFLESKKISAPIYHDHSNNIVKQVGGRYPIPMEIEVKNLKVERVEIGGPIE